MHDQAIAMHIAPKLLTDEPFAGYSSVSVYSVATILNNVDNEP